MHDVAGCSGHRRGLSVRDLQPLSRLIHLKINDVLRAISNELFNRISHENEY